MSKSNRHELSFDDLESQARGLVILIVDFLSGVKILAGKIWPPGPATGTPKNAQITPKMGVLGRFSGFGRFWRFFAFFAFLAKINSLSI